MSENSATTTEVVEEATTSQQTAEVIPVSLTKAFDNDVGELHSAAKNAEDAKENHRRAFVDLCTKIYLFKKAHGEDEIADWLEAKGLKVTAKANDWTPVT